MTDSTLALSSAKPLMLAELLFMTSALGLVQLTF